MFKAEAENAAESLIEGGAHESTASDHDVQCPICNKLFPSTQIDQHVEQCLCQASNTEQAENGNGMRATNPAAGQGSQHSALTGSPSQWAEMRRCELNILLQRRLSAHQLTILAERLRGFIRQIRSARPDVFPDAQ